MPPKAKKSSMSVEHKAALAEGRRQGAAVRNYLEALEQHRPKRGRKRTSESIRKRLGVIEAELGAAVSAILPGAVSAFLSDFTLESSFVVAAPLDMTLSVGSGFDYLRFCGALALTYRSTLRSNARERFAETQACRAG